MNTLKNNHYSLIARFYWRFVFLYLVLYIFPYGFEYIHVLNTEAISFWKGITIWFGNTFLGWEFNKDSLFNGFDSKFDYSRFLLIAIISLIGSVIWLFIDSKLKHVYTHTIKLLVQTILRYHIGLTLILYGISKVFLLQFGSINITDLDSKIGDKTGMEFLWTFMSYSELYSIVSGVIEVIGGVLLLFRKTTFIGAFILFVVMANVVLLDIGYDVSVKMFAIHLFIMTVLLMSDRLKQLVRFFITNKATVPYTYQSLFNSKKAKNRAHVVKGIFLLYITIAFANDIKVRISTEKTNHYNGLSSKHEIGAFIKNGETIPASNTTGERWETMWLNCHNYVPEHISVTYSDEKVDWFSFEADTILKTIDFKPSGDTTGLKYSFEYKAFGENNYIFQGVYKGDSLWFSTKAKTIKDYLLTKKRLRWIRDLK